MEKCNSLDLLKSNNLKVTRQRRALLDEIINSTKPFTANDLFLKFKTSIDLATIYRILHIFKDNQIIREVITKDENKYFEISCMHNPVHPHLICDNCGEVDCLASLGENQIKSIKKAYTEYSINHILLNFSGLCNKCKT